MRGLESIELLLKATLAHCRPTLHLVDHRSKIEILQLLHQFKTETGETKAIRYASAAVLEMTDSPVHARIVDVRQGSGVLLPSGQPHGIVSDDPSVPIRALLTFTPGLAPEEEQEFRDEEVIHLRASDRLREIGQIDSNKS